MGIDKQLNTFHRGAGNARPFPGGVHSLDNVSPGLQRLAGAWVAVSEQRPPYSGDYLVLLRDRSYRIMDYAVSGDTFFPRGLSRAVTHWRELPPPPA